MREYTEVVKSVLSQGLRKPNRTGVDTVSTFGVFYRVNQADGFPLLTTKKVSWKNVVCENLWFLSGEPGVEFLRKHGCKFWDPWADTNGLVPSAYGNLWRRFPSSLIDYDVDQISNAIHTLDRDPDSRRVVVSAWNPHQAINSKLPPCHYSFVLNVLDGKLNLHTTQRSCDVALGLPYNLAGYSFLLHLFARFLGLEPGQFAHTLVDCHIYVNHIDGLTQQIVREPRKLPELEIDESVRCLDDVEEIIREATTEQILETFKIVGYDPHPAIQYEVAV